MKLHAKYIRDAFYREALAHAMVATLNPDLEWQAKNHFEKARYHYKRVLGKLKMKDTVAQKRMKWEHWKECIRKEMEGKEK